MPRDYNSTHLLKNKMGQAVGLMICTFTLDEHRFWRILEWCYKRGATEFYIRVASPSGLEDADKLDTLFWRTFLKFKQPDQQRWVPSYCLWETEESVNLWVLNDESLQELKRTAIGRLFTPTSYYGVGIYGMSQSPSRQGGVSLHHLCLYREGRPILGIFEEQWPELLVVLQRSELELFHAEGFGVEFELVEDYFPQYFG
jgi:hypothetical protein